MSYWNEAERRLREELVEVASWEEPGLSYEWDEWHAYWDAARDVYVVGMGRGCSCDCYGPEHLDEAGVTSKSDLIASLKQWVYGSREPGTPAWEWEPPYETEALLASYRGTVAAIRAWKKPRRIDEETKA